ncbi:cell division protein FtsH [Rhodococcus aetherivorans]|uniref:Cell division protein FtsH n=1 Tax=Rhodococcus aetherivorans TaxID=191292 RepID=A0ABQ0YI51_9NOCA|nr:ATP-binding protein [Rhodococcus aetherivorans]ETT24119.1 AAA ATPase central domain protein [Rhodococcus rhodochrous ATCC 21198]NGP28896.1 ATP-binding protein [Rhodococcus aetherivorans]GES36236.1 cell division protein FtsH [Rhodococcus aetherivorans]
MTAKDIHAGGDAQESARTQRADQPDALLEDVEPSPASYFQVNVHAAVLLLVDHLRDLDGAPDLRTVLNNYPFLTGYLDAIMPFLPPGVTWQQAHRWWARRIAAWEHPDRTALALCRLGAALSLSDVARAQLLLAGLAEEDSRFGQIFADLNGGLSRRPTFETLTAVGGHLDAGEALRGALLLIDRAVLTVTHRDGPRSEWVLSTSAELWDQIRGDAPPRPDHRPVTLLPKLADLVVDDTVVARCRRVADRWTEFDLITLRGAAGSDRLTLAAAIAQAAGKGLLTVDAAELASGRWDGVGALAAALDAVPVVELDLAPGDTATVPRPAGLPGPIVVVLGGTGGVDRRGHDRAVSLELPALDAAGRARRWRQALGPAPVDDIDGIAAACRLQGAHIDRVARSAISLATIDGAPAVRLDHVRAAADELQHQLLDTLATKLEVTGSWDDVVVGDFTAVKLTELHARCQHRDVLAASMGPAYGVGTQVGVRALFTGPSGTGKTLAARVLGNQLGLDVYRVDLAAIINKYVGETEKNLHRILTTAEELDVMLLIDEGDSLLGRRTEVRSANDRFANLETNYLLQRLEHYRGIIVITTNAADHIDSAFQRRMDVVVAFTPPTQAERAGIWRLHLPDNHQVPESLITELAHRCTMTGGQIRNAVLHATLLALGENRPVTARHLDQAIAGEYQKAGASSPYDPSGRQCSVSRARSFQQVIA